MEFRQRIRNYNNAFAFSSIGVKQDLSVYGPRDIYIFHIEGQLYHLIGSLLPLSGRQPAFLQIYIYDSDPMQQAQQRMCHHDNLLNVNIILPLQAMFHQCDPYIEIFLTAHERLMQNENISLRIKSVDLLHYDLRQYNHPMANEIAVILPRTGDEPMVGRDLVLQTRSNRL